MCSALVPNNYGEPMGLPHADPEKTLTASNNRPGTGFDAGAGRSLFADKTSGCIVGSQSHFRNGNIKHEHNMLSNTFQGVPTMMDQLLAKSAHGPGLVSVDN